MKHTIQLKEGGQITAIISDGEHPLIIHHKEGLTIGLDREEMMALASVLATLEPEEEDGDDLLAEMNSNYYRDVMPRQERLY